jgi:hypothetical protein
MIVVRHAHAPCRGRIVENSQAVVIQHQLVIVVQGGFKLPGHKAAIRSKIVKRDMACNDKAL